MAFIRFNPTRPPRLPSSIRLLYVEDEDTNSGLAQVALRDLYNVTNARNARDTFRLLREQRFDLMMMDIQLSGSDLNGIQITQALRGMPMPSLPTYATRLTLPDLPIIFVTAYTAAYTRAELQAVGGNDLIEKPVDFAKLSTVIGQLLAATAEARK